MVPAKSTHADPFHCCHVYVTTLVAVTLKTALLPEQTVLLVGAVVITGNWPSLTVTVNVQVDVLPEASVAVDVTVVVPRLKTLPEAGVLTTVVPGQLSVAVTVNGTVAVQDPIGVDTVMFAGQVITGAWVSFTVTVNVQVAILPTASVALNTLVVVPIGNVLPLGRPWVCVVVTPGQLSTPTGVT